MPNEGDDVSALLRRIAAVQEGIVAVQSEHTEALARLTKHIDTLTASRTTPAPSHLVPYQSDMSTTTPISTQYWTCLSVALSAMQDQGPANVYIMNIPSVPTFQVPPVMTICKMPPSETTTNQATPSETTTNQATPSATPCQEPEPERRIKVEPDDAFVTPSPPPPLRSPPPLTRALRHDKLSRILRSGVQKIRGESNEFCKIFNGLNSRGDLRGKKQVKNCDGWCDKLHQCSDCGNKTHGAVYCRKRCKSKNKRTVTSKAEGSKSDVMLVDESFA
jgi:hypothetical protein